MLKITGYSDDTLSCDGPMDYAFNRDDCDTCAADGKTIVVDIGEPPVLRVRGMYNVPWNTAGTWTLGVELAEEGAICPWPIRIVHGDVPYSMTVEIDCPSGTFVWIREEPTVIAERE
jgi:hypothetical protein